MERSRNLNKPRQGYGLESHALSLYVQVNSRKSQDVCKTDYLENMRADFLRRNMTVVLEKLAACRAKSIGLFLVPRDVFGSGGRKHNVLEVRVNGRKKQRKK